MVLFLILFVLVFHQYWSKVEPMADVQISDQIKEAVKAYY
jgi:hypothetical protein